MRYTVKLGVIFHFNHLFCVKFPMSQPAGAHPARMVFLWHRMVMANLVKRLMAEYHPAAIQ
jgi:hypothetical protein